VFGVCLIFPIFLFHFFYLIFIFEFINFDFIARIQYK